MVRASFAVVIVAGAGLLAGCGSSVTSGAPSDAGGPWEDVVSDAGAPIDAGDESAPAIAVTLSASSTQVAAAGSITLTATAEAAGATVGKIEFYEGTTLLATKNASPATLDVAFVEGDNGTHTYTAKAYTPAASASSAPLAVTVAIPKDPCGVDRTRCTATGCPPGLCLSPSHVASGFGAWSRSRGIHDTMLAGSIAFDTKTGALGGVRAANADATIYEVIGGIGFVRTHQTGSEPDLAIWVFSSLMMNGVLATFTGDAAAVLAVAKDATISGSRFDLSAKGQTAGPGGFSGGVYAMDGLGCAGGKGSATGGGGGGFGSDGALGGAGAAGLAASCEGAYGELLSLRGGSGGGAGDDSNSAATEPFGGGGGGAIQISAFGALSLDAIVHVGGGAGRTSQGNWRSGAGAGSGGAIFLESPSITIASSAGLFANGGGGGSTSPGTGGACGSPAAAQDGQPTLVAAQGSHCGSGYGGDGAAGMVAAKPGMSNGGGGAGLGRIVLRTLSNATAMVATSNLSPGPGATAYRVLPNL
jgi:hypothetical protein